MLKLVPKDAALLDLKTWEPWEYRGLRFEVRRMQRGTRSEFKRMMAVIGKLTKTHVKEDIEEALVYESEASLLEAIDQLTEQQLGKCVDMIDQHVRLLDEPTLDGERITVAWYAREDQEFMLSCMLRMNVLASLTVTQGKDSGSPSGSETEGPKTSDTESAATPTEGAAGQ